MSKARPSTFTSWSILMLGGLTPISHLAANEQEMEEVVVESTPSHYSGVDLASELKKSYLDMYVSGGAAYSPIISGLKHDRVKVVVDGMEGASACANHMNSAGTYIDPHNIDQLQIFAGITPVSMGGDSIAGTIQVSAPELRYAQEGQSALIEGQLQLGYRSNNKNAYEALQANIASQQWSLNYRGSNDKAESGRDGQDQLILDTLYRAEKHALSLGHKRDDQQIELTYKHHYTPYQGFPNQYMDMVDDRTDSINFHYRDQLSWGTLDTRVTWQDIRHQMGFFTDEKPGVMPMQTDANDLGFVTKLLVPTGQDSTAQFGAEFHQLNLDDYWPAVTGNMMLGPNTFINIEDGMKQRSALWVETDAKFSPRLRSRFGLRYEQVITNAGEVQGYADSVNPNMGTTQDPLTAFAFNHSERKRTDNNIDLTASFLFQKSATVRWEWGYARKTRTPNLYERYSWNQNPMAMSMIGWYGDGNGYVGNLDLEPEIAHTLAFSVTRSDPRQHSWELEIAPFYTYIDDYIDARVIGNFNPQQSTNATRNLLRMTNEDATIYGINLRLVNPLWSNSFWGQGRLRWQIQHTRGERQYSNDPLYQIMPTSVTIGMDHTLNSLQSYIEAQWVDEKSDLDPRRLESYTQSFALVNLGTRYHWQQSYLSLSLDNILDEYYQQPLGGVSIAQWKSDGKPANFSPLNGPGRSVNLHLSLSF